MIGGRKRLFFILCAIQPQLCRNRNILLRFFFRLAAADAAPGIHAGVSKFRNRRHLLGIFRSMEHHFSKNFHILQKFDLIFLFILQNLCKIIIVR